MQGEHGSEGRPQDHQRHQHGRGPAVEALHELRHHELGGEHLPPRNHPEQREVEQEIAHRAAEDREEDRARDHLGGLPDLVADVADVVVAEVVVDRDEGGAAQAEDEPAVEGKGAGGEVERPRGIEMAQATGEDGHHRRHRSRPQRHRDPAQERDPPREQDDGEQTDARAHEAITALGEPGPEVAGVLAEADEPGGDLQGAAEHERPDEQEGHQPPPLRRAVGLAQETVAAPRAGKGGPQLAPHLPVAEHDERAHPPAEQRLRAAHGRHEEGDRDERTDPDHVGHVEGGRVEKAEAAGEVRGGGSGRRVRVHDLRYLASSAAGGAYFSRPIASRRAPPCSGGATPLSSREDPWNVVEP